MKSIFISSTFRDMQKERDLLNQEVMPKINHEASKLKRTLSFSDLRWGIDTSSMSEQEANLKVLSVCFDEIKRCEPYIIVLLGDRYGYVPEDPIVRGFLQEYDVSFDSNGKSVTHMEIEQGVLNKVTNNKDIFIYIRNTDYSGIPDSKIDLYFEKDEAVREKLNILKSELTSKFPESVKTYNARWNTETEELEMPDFVDMVFEDINRKLLTEYGECNYLSDCHEQLAENVFFVESHIIDSYIPHDMLMQHKSDIQSHTAPLFCFTGEGGCGKSTFLCNLYHAVKEDWNDVGFITCGTNPFTSSVRGIAEYVLCCLAKKTGREYDYMGSSMLTYSQIIERILALRSEIHEKFIFFIDSADRTEDTDSVVRFINWIVGFMREYVTLVVSFRDNSILSDKLSEEKRISTISYGYTDCIQIIRCILKSEKKQLNENLQSCIMKKKGSSNPLWIRLMVRRLLMMDRRDFKEIYNKGGDIDEINNRLRQLIDESPDSSPQLAGVIVNEVADRINMEQTVMTMVLLCASRYGLRENDFKDILSQKMQWNSVDFARMIKSLSDFFIWRENGIIDFSHDEIRIGVSEALRCDTRTINAILASYLEKLISFDEFAAKEFAWHAYKGSYNDGFARYLISSLDKNPKEIKTNEQYGRLLKEIIADGGVSWLIECINSCENEEEAISYIVMLGSALSNCEYANEQEAVVVVNMILTIIEGVKILPTLIIINNLRRCSSIMLKVGRKNDAENLSNMANKLESQKYGQQEKMVVTDIETLYRAERRAKQLIDAKQYDKAYEICKAIEVYLEEQDDELLIKMARADVMTKLGMILKEQNKWREAIIYGEKSLAIYEALRVQIPSDEVERKYRARIYNLGNDYEAWAMNEGYSQELLDKAKSYYEQSYLMDVVAMSDKMRVEDYRNAISLIFSYGTVLIRIGQKNEGMEKYSEAKNIAKDMARKTSMSSVYSDLVMNCLECSYQLIESKLYKESCSVIDDIIEYIEKIIENDDSDSITDLRTFIRAYTSNINRHMANFFSQNDIDNAILCSHTLISISKKIIKLLDAEGWYNLFTNCKNLGDMYFLSRNDYENALEEYISLLELVDTYDLIHKAGEVSSVQKICDNIGMICIRAINCFIRLERKEEAIKLSGEVKDRLLAINKYIPQFHDNPSHILVAIAEKLDRVYPEVLLQLLVPAMQLVEAINDEETKHTMMLRIMALII